MSRSSHSDVIIIGGGAIGVACAYYLNKSGRSVRILERHTIGSGASHGNCGLIVPSHVLPISLPGVPLKSLKWMLRADSPLYIRPTLNLSLIAWLLRFAGHCNDRDMRTAASARVEILGRSREMFGPLIAEEKMDCDWQHGGVLYVYRDEDAMQEYAETDAILREYDMPARQLDRDAVLEMEPALADDVCGAWLYEQDAHLRPDRLLAEWRRVLVAAGVEIEEECAVTGFDIGNGTISGVRTARGVHSAESYVLATGAWSPRFARQLGIKIPIQPGKGYSITMNRPALCPAIPCIFTELKSVATPWASGYRLGGTMEFSGYREGLPRARLAALRHAAGQYLKDPEGDEVIEEWFGFRPMTYDGVPIIDRSPRQENLYIAAGHNMVGISAAPATGHLIADLIGNREPIINPAPYRLARFR